MIQPAAQPVASVTLSVSGQPAENGTPGAENGSFADVLAGQPDQAGADPSPATLAAAQPNLAAALPLTGKILPGLLPDAATAAGQGAGDQAGQDPASQTIPTLLAAMRALRLPVPVLPGAKTSTQQPGEAAAPADPAEDGETDGTQLLGLLTIGANPASGTPQTAAVETAPTGQTGLPPMIEAQLLGRPLALRDAAQIGTSAPAGKSESGPAELALKLDPAKTDPAAAAALSFEPDSARPTSGVRLRPVLAAERETPMPGAAAPAADTASLLASPTTMASPLANTAAPAIHHGTQAHDFAALMDRLITARDAAQTGLPQSVSVAVNHAEFGPISLQFQHDQAGLAVSVASADPDFARAVQAAIPAASAAAGADGGSRDNAQGSSGQAWAGQGTPRGDASATGGEAGQRQSRAASAFDPDATGPALNRSAEARDAAPSRQRGIFA